MSDDDSVVEPRRSRHSAPFISFEGGEGAGKTTQASILKDRLESEGRRALQVREPGSTQLGDTIREIIKSPNENVPAADALLFMAARAQLMNDVVEPNLKDGVTVICDRFADSTLAYQGFGGKLDLTRLRHANELATDGNVPDLTIFLSIDPDEGLARRHVEDSSNEDAKRRFEELPRRFHFDVLKGYRELAAEEPNRWVEVDASQSIDVVSKEVWRHVSRFFD